MIQLVVIRMPDNLGATVDDLLLQLKTNLEAESGRLTAGSNAGCLNTAESRPTNKGQVEGLKQRCLPREVKTADVIVVADVDESQFFKWQRGAYVGKRTRVKIETTCALSALEFLKRLDAPVLEHFRPERRWH